MLARIEQSDLMDASWYLERYPDVVALGMAPAEHYLRIGAGLLRDPGPDFSTAFYLAEHPDVVAAGVNPLWHYLAHGLDEGRRCAPSGYHLPECGPPHPVPLLQAEPIEDPAARLICFYLPQFHTIPENDEWWGDGFTEWTNVKRASPQFIRHYQPHVPSEDIGYYDLSTAEHMHRQVEQARLYGVSGFCFYFYWFAGKRLLEQPIRNYFQDARLDLPFCLCWANENWSRRWDGRDQDVLIAQEHSPEDDLDFIRHVAQYMTDPRYIRVGGKPLLLVYRPNLLPNALETSIRWRTWCRENGVGEIYLAYTQSFESNNPEDYGFDAATEFPPNNSSVPLITRHANPHADFQGRIFDWGALVERSYQYIAKPYTLFRAVCPSWDNTARRGKSSTILANSSPQRFTEWIRNAVRDTTRRFDESDQRVVFVNAWNEWAEGAHLEPDRRYGYAWLESVRVALESCRSREPEQSGQGGIAFVLEGATTQLIKRAIAACAALVGRHILCVAVDTARIDGVRTLLDASETEYILESVSQGDHEPWLLTLMRHRRLDGYEMVVRLRCEASVKEGDDVERTSLDPERIKDALARFSADPRLGMLCPDLAPGVDDGNARCVVRLGARLGLPRADVVAQEPWSGRSFIARRRALHPVASLAFAQAEFRRGTAEHNPYLVTALERAFPLSAVACDMHVASDRLPATMTGKRRVVIVSHDAHPHGAQLLALNMARSCGQLGFDVDMIVLGPGRLLEHFVEVATVHRLDMASQPVSDTLRLLAALRQAGASAAIVNTTVSGTLTPLLKQAGFTVVSLIHELPGVLSSYGLQSHAQAIAEYADRIVFPARIVRDGFEKFVERELQRSVIRPQGLYLRTPHRTQVKRSEMRTKVRRDLGLDADARLVLCVGYGDHRKGLDLFVETCAHAMAADDRVVGVWVGHAEQALFEEVQASIAECGLQDRFVFTGLVNNPEDYYAAADVYALTSREDPFPSVVMEALDAFVPVVSFAGVVGSEELLGRGAGVVVPAFDTMAMAEVVNRLLEDHEWHAELASCGNAIVNDEMNFRHYMFDLLAYAGITLPKVSVVVPNYNYASYIEERLSSVIGQTAPVFELIVLDDCSSDHSVPVIERFLSSCNIPNRLLVNRRNSGSVFRQWQLGVEMARGDYVWIAEADDLADPKFLAEALPAFSDPRVGLSYTQSKQMGRDGEILCEHYLDYVSDIDPERWTRPYTVDGRDEIRTALFIKNTIPNVSSVVFRKSALHDVLIRYGEEIMSYRNAGDWVAYVRLLERHAISYSPKALNLHRRHQKSVTIGSFNIDQLMEIVKVQQDVIERHRLGVSGIAAHKYAQKLYVQFGLQTDHHPEYDSHPTFRKIV